jgi:hypothetical protein
LSARLSKAGPPLRSRVLVTWTSRTKGLRIQPANFTGEDWALTAPRRRFSKTSWSCSQSRSNRSPASRSLIYREFTGKSFVLGVQGPSTCPGKPQISGGSGANSLRPEQGIHSRATGNDQRRAGKNECRISECSCPVVEAPEPRRRVLGPANVVFLARQIGRGAGAAGGLRRRRGAGNSIINRLASASRFRRMVSSAETVSPREVAGTPQDSPGNPVRCRPAVR